MTAKKKWVITGYAPTYRAYGCRCDCNINYDEDGTEVATFDTEKLAKDYVERAKLKNPKDSDRPFRERSLLTYYESVSIDVYDPPIYYPPTHNPTI